MLASCASNPENNKSNKYLSAKDNENAEKILNSFLEDKPLKPGSFKNTSKNTTDNSNIQTNGRNNA